MAAPQRPFRAGTLRPTQVLHTFGVGSLVDLPGLSVLVLGLDEWDEGSEAPIQEHRLLQAVRARVGRQVQALRLPPLPPETSGYTGSHVTPVGLPVMAFPRWLVCSSCHLLAPLTSGLFQLKPNPYRPERSRYVHETCPRAGSASKKRAPSVVPARFVSMCERGHLDDFPWVSFVHQGPTTCTYKLELHERGLEAQEVFVRCRTCDARRPMGHAFSHERDDILPACPARYPHLNLQGDACTSRLHPSVLGASNLWFPMTLSALSIPVAADPLTSDVERLWEMLSRAQSAGDINTFKRLGVLRGLEDYSDEAVWEAIERRKGKGGKDPEPTPDLKLDEWNALVNCDRATDSREFQAHGVQLPRGFESYFVQIAQVERLREVQALIGFSRLESPRSFQDPDAAEQRRVPLSRKDPEWVPATEVYGEGIFIQFREDTLRKWESRVETREEEFLRAHCSWRRALQLEPVEAGFPGMRLILLQSFAHAFLRRVSMDCGYSAASLRERLYALDADEESGPMAGVLIYTASPDSEGTLGGLVSLAEPDRLGELLVGALVDATRCSSDPICAEHDPETRVLHGAACHACLFISETSCEKGNRYLDRCLLVETLRQGNLHLFDLDRILMARQGAKAGGLESLVEGRRITPWAESPDGIYSPIPVWSLDPDGTIQIIGYGGVETDAPRGQSFIVEVAGRAVDREIKPGDWGLFRKVENPEVLATIEEIVLVHVPDQVDPETGSHFMLRKLTIQRRLRASDDTSLYTLRLRPFSHHRGVYRSMNYDGIESLDELPVEVLGVLERRLAPSEVPQ